MTDETTAAIAARAFDAGEWTVAREACERLAASPSASAEVWGNLAWARLRLGDAAEAHAAAEAAVTRDAACLRALLVKSELLTAEGDLRTANFYNGVITDVADRSPPTAPDLVQGVDRARRARADVRANLLTLVQDELRAVGYSERTSHPRFTFALDILTGRKQPYFQQPTRLYYPELPNIQFFAREQFPWLDQVEAATDAMIEELEQVLQEGTTFAPYMRSVPNMPKGRDPLIDSMDWSICPLVKGGVDTPMAAMCPRTMAALVDAPLPRIPASSPDVLFSQLRPGAHILPHTGATNTRLICHLPLIVPPGCRFRVGNDVREWKKGKAWVFDDTIEHEAQNTSDRTRVILMFDIWRPELDEEERALLTTLFEAMYSYAPDRSVSIA